MSYHALTLIKEMWPDFPATEKDIRNPSQEFLMRFYEKFFDECALLELRMKTPPNVLHPESLNDTLPIISTRAFLSYIFSYMRGPEVGIDDIIDPNPKKTARLLEIFTNFTIYVDCHCGKYSLIAFDNASQAVIEKEELIQEIDKIKETINEIAIRKGESASELKKLDNKLFETIELRDSVKEQCMQAEEESQLLLDNLSKEKLENSALEKEIEKELEEIASQKEKIVSSPDTVSRTIAELNLKKRDMESEVANLRNRAKQMMLMNTNLEQISSMIQSKIPQVNDLAANLTLLRDLENGLIEDEATLKASKEKFDAVAGNYQALEKHIAQWNQKIRKIKEKNIEEQTALEESIQQALRQKTEAEQKQIESGAQQVVIAQEIHQLKEEIKDVEKDKKEFIEYFYEMEDTIHDNVRMFKISLCKEAERILQIGG